MAIAGFLTLGVGWEQNFADQLRLIKPEKGAPQFVLEPGITTEKLDDFRNKLEKNEPEFIVWLEKNCKSIEGICAILLNAK